MITQSKEKRPGRVRSSEKTLCERWSADKERTLVALRAGWSASAIERSYGIPHYVTCYWRTEAGIPKPNGKVRPTPDVGQILN